MSTDRAPMLDRTLERFDQRAGVEGGSGGRQLCLFFLAHHESGQIVGEFQRPKKLSKNRLAQSMT